MTSTVESYFIVSIVKKNFADGSVIRFNDYPWQASEITMDAVSMTYVLGIKNTLLQPLLFEAI